MEEIGRLLGEIHISQKQTGIFCSGVIPVYLFGPGIMAMTKTLHEKVEVCENNRTRRITKRVDKL